MTFGADLIEDSRLPGPIEISGNQECRAYEDTDSTTDHRKSIFEGQTIRHTLWKLGCEGYQPESAKPQR